MKLSFQKDKWTKFNQKGENLCMGFKNFKEGIEGGSSPYGATRRRHLNGGIRCAIRRVKIGYAL